MLKLASQYNYSYLSIIFIFILLVFIFLIQPHIVQYLWKRWLYYSEIFKVFTHCTFTGRVIQNLFWGDFFFGENKGECELKSVRYQLTPSKMGERQGNREERREGEFGSFSKSKTWNYYISSCRLHTQRHWKQRLKYLCVNVYSSTIYSWQKVGMIKIPINKWINQLWYRHTIEYFFLREDKFYFYFKY